MSEKTDVKKAKPIDLGSLDTNETAERGAVLEVLHPTDGTPLGLKITLAGTDSDIFQKAQNKMSNKRAKRFKPGQSFSYPAEEQAANTLSLLATCTLGWEASDDFMLDGQPFPPYDRETALELYQRFVWLREQADAFISDRANFLSR